MNFKNRRKLIKWPKTGLFSKGITLFFSHGSRGGSFKEIELSQLSSAKFAKV
jgi:hypothetical protein